MKFICPVCHCELTEEEKLFRCSNRHCFDKSKFGYVNLLQSQKSSSKRHGDDRLMIRARRDFLDGGYYAFLLDELCDISKKYTGESPSVIDAGCGECYYSSAIKTALQSVGKTVDFAGVDISKDALEFASKRKSGISLAVASVFELPFSDESADLLFNVFSPEADREYLRVLKRNGIMIRVIPLEKHLFELKAAIYDKPYLNEVPTGDIDGFTLSEAITICREVELFTNGDIMNLFMMTPYYYKTGKTDQQKIKDLEYLKTKAEFEIRIYKKD